MVNRNSSRLKNLPVGVFDSGLGGLTVVKEIINVLPNEDIIYLGDTARVPYGTRSKIAVIRFSLEDAKFLIKKKVKVVVVACNTASALAGKELKKKLKIPVFEVVTPALKEAKKISKKGKIGVIGTRGTVQSGAYKVSHLQACPLLVPFIEEGETDGKAIEIVLKSYLSPLKGKIDTLIMGCTHYPIIEKPIGKEIGKKVKLINPAKCVANELKEYLTRKKLLNPKKKPGRKEYYVTDLTTHFKNILTLFLGDRISVLRKISLKR